MQSEYVPTDNERYIDIAELGSRWKCHPKTAARRFRDFGGATLLIGGSVRYPLSIILAIERESLSKFARRRTQMPPQFLQAQKRLRERRKERLARQTQSRKTQIVGAAK